MGLDPLEHRNTVDPLAEPNLEISSNDQSRENSADHGVSRNTRTSPDSSGSFDYADRSSHTDGDSERGSSQGADSSQGQSNPGSKNYKEYVGRHLTSELLFSASIGD